MSYQSVAITRKINSASLKLSIAQIAPLYESVPPRLYGGTERIVHYLTEELVRRGHHVTLFASGDSRTSATLVAGYPRSLRLAGLCADGPALHQPMISEVYKHAADFDIIHSHVEYWPLAMARLVATPTISTIHSRLDTESQRTVFAHFLQQPVVSVSDAQRAHLPDLNWLGTVHHGLPPDLLRFNPGPGKYLAFLGRIAPEKRPDLAIAIARRAGVPLKIAAKISEDDRPYFESVIKPMLDGPEVEYVGEVNEQEKAEFLGNAIALIFPIDWPEPFGLVMIEALACGTPVIARPCGSVPEIVRDGETGFLRAEFDDLVDAVHRAETLSRAACRADFERRFTVATMADKYENLFQLALRSEVIRQPVNFNLMTGK